jgi:hypothetical protein
MDELGEAIHNHRVFGKQQAMNVLEEGTQNHRALGRDHIALK